MRATKEQYLRLMEDRPKKFDANQVGYRRAELTEDTECQHCIHFYRRQVDKFSVCEIFRDEDTDRHGIDPRWVCDFFTPDGEEFPLL